MNGKFKHLRANFNTGGIIIIQKREHSKWFWLSTIYDDIFQAFKEKQMWLGNWLRCTGNSTASSRLFVDDWRYGKRYLQIYFLLESIEVLDSSVKLSGLFWFKSMRWEFLISCLLLEHMYIYLVVLIIGRNNIYN